MMTTTFDAIYQSVTSKANDVEYSMLSTLS
jgi:hypothetical protein